MHRLAIILAMSLLLAAPGYAQAPRVTGKAGDWVRVEAGGLVIYQTWDMRTGSHIEIACDEAMTLDRSATGIAIEIGGKMLPAHTQLSFTVDSQTITIPSGASGGVSVRGRPECADKFTQFWRLLSQGTRLTVTASNGSGAAFSLRGMAKLMSPELCLAGS